MRKTFLMILLVALYQNTNAATVPENAATPALMIRLSANGKLISFSNFLYLTPKEFANISGKKMNFFERIKFKAAQKIAKRFVEKKGTIGLFNQRKRKGFFSSWSWHWGGFAFGFLPILGPIVCLFFSDDYKWDRFSTALFMNGIIASAALIFLQVYGG
jgi:hypothetical protein